MKGKRNLMQNLNICQVCGVKFINIDFLKSHYWDVHTDIPNKIFLDEYMSKYINPDMLCGTGDLKVRKKRVRSDEKESNEINKKYHRLSQDKYDFISDNFKVSRQTVVGLAEYLFLTLNLKKEEITQEHIAEHKPKFISTTLDYFLLKTNGDIKEAKRLLTLRQGSTSKKAFVEKYGEEEGGEKYLEHFHNIHTKMKGHKSYTSLEAFVEKYGEDEGNKKYKEHIVKITPSLENFISRHGEEEGTKKFKEWKKAIGATLPNFVKRYGEEEGLKRYTAYRAKVSGARGKASKESLNIFLPLLNFVRELDMEDQLSFGYENNREFYLQNVSEDKVYIYDFTLRKIKVIIEYNGTTWHPNKNKLTEAEWKTWLEPYSKMSADEKYAYDEKKRKFAEDKGFAVLEVWSDDDIEYSIKKAKEFILKHMERGDEWMIWI